MVLSLGAADCVTLRKKESPGLRMYLNCICELLFVIFVQVPILAEVEHGTQNKVKGRHVVTMTSTVSVLRLLVKPDND